MKTILIEQTSITPKIECKNHDEILIQGRSLPYDGVSFFEPLIQKIKTLKQEVIIIHIDLEIMNSSSVVLLTEVFEELYKNSSIQKLRINWYYEEDDDVMIERGMALKENAPKGEFNLIQK